jgi:DNA-binding response OmpR family regulator
MVSGGPSKKILIVDDDKLWRGNLTRFFALSGYTVLSSPTCAGAMETLPVERPDCVLLDFHLGDGDGGEFCLKLRGDAALKKTPVIIVSADPAEELNAYSAYKADGFILKGCSLEKIAAVVESVLRRVEMERGALECGELKLDPDGCRLFRKGRQAAVLPPEQFRLLALLLEASPRPVPEDEIAVRVLGGRTDSQRTEAVYSLVYRLRRSLGPQLSLRVKNLSGRGWAYAVPRSCDPEDL